MDNFTRELNRKLAGVLGPRPAAPRKCSHRSFYGEGYDEATRTETLRCASCGVRFTSVNGGRKRRI